MSDERSFEQWSWMPCADLEIVQARMGPCGLDGHFHDKWSLGLILSGGCRFNSGSRHYAVTPSELFIIPPYEVHQCAAASDDVAYRVMYVSDDMLAAAAPQMRRLVAASSVRVKKLPASLLAALRQIGGRERDEALLQGCLRQLDRHFRTADHARAPQSSHPLQDILHQQWQQAVDLGAAEQATRYSRWHAVHTFRDQVGLTPGRYLRQLRALKSRYLLQEGKPLAEVADALHFADQAHFTRVFKSVFGVSPGRLQRLMLGQSSRAAPTKPD